MFLECILSEFLYKNSKLDEDEEEAERGTSATGLMVDRRHGHKTWTASKLHPASVIDPPPTCPIVTALATTVATASEAPGMASTDAFNRQHQQH